MPAFANLQMPVLNRVCSKLISTSTQPIKSRRICHHWWKLGQLKLSYSTNRFCAFSIKFPSNPLFIWIRFEDTTIKKRAQQKKSHEAIKNNLMKWVRLNSIKTIEYFCCHFFFLSLSLSFFRCCCVSFYRNANENLHRKKNPTSTIFTINVCDFQRINFFARNDIERLTIDSPHANGMLLQAGKSPLSK